MSMEYNKPLSIEELEAAFSLAREKDTIKDEVDTAIISEKSFEETTQRGFETLKTLINREDFDKEKNRLLAEIESLVVHTSYPEAGELFFFYIFCLIGLNILKN